MGVLVALSVDVSMAFPGLPPTPQPSRACDSVQGWMLARPLQALWAEGPSPESGWGPGEVRGSLDRRSRC